MVLNRWSQFTSHESGKQKSHLSFMTIGRICAQDLKCIVFVLFLSDAQYITCKMQNCSEATRSKPFPGYIDHNSLIVQGDYVFVQVQNTLFSYLFYYFILYYSTCYYFLLHSFACVCMCVVCNLSDSTGSTKALSGL